jgi:aspartate-semialdehyde dehydrogenase
VPHAARGGAIAVDTSSAYRLHGVPLVGPEVDSDRAREHDGIVANPNCCTIPLSMVLKPLHDGAGLARVRVSRYQSMSGAGAHRMEELRRTPPAEAHLDTDWDYDGVDFDEEVKLRAETRKILELPDPPISVTSVRVPVLIGHTEPCGWKPKNISRPKAREASCPKRRVYASKMSRVRATQSAPTTPARTRAQRRDDRQRARPLRRLRQPAQGRGAQRDPDRGATPGALRSPSLRGWRWLVCAWLSPLLTARNRGNPRRIAAVI